MRLCWAALARSLFTLSQQIRWYALYCLICSLAGQYICLLCIVSLARFIARLTHLFVCSELLHLLALSLFGRFVCLLCTASPTCSLTFLAYLFAPPAAIRSNDRTSSSVLAQTAALSRLCSLIFVLIGLRETCEKWKNKVDCWK